jgi:hypothetical protein
VAKTRQRTGKAAPSGAAAPAIALFQPYRSVADKQRCDSQCTPVQLTATRSDLFGVIDWLSGQAKGPRPALPQSGYWGLLPLDFERRTGITVAAWRKAIDDNPGKDAYLMNTLPAEEALYPNPVSRLFLEFSEFRALLPEGYAKNQVAASPAFSIAPYCVATPAFWRSYWKYVKEQLAIIEKKASPKQKKELSVPQSSSPVLLGESIQTVLAGALLSLFLKSDSGSDFKALKIALPGREKELNAHLLSLRQLKDAAVKARSPWLVSCWLNYRNLYVYQVNGKQWCAQHLADITPVSSNGWGRCYRRKTISSYGFRRDLRMRLLRCLTPPSFCIKPPTFMRRSQSALFGGMTQTLALTGHLMASRFCLPKTSRPCCWAQRRFLTDARSPGLGYLAARDLLRTPGLCVG